MSAPQWSASDLAELYRLFSKLRRNASAEQRRQLAWQVVLHEGSTVRLKAARRSVLKRLARARQLWTDVLHQAMLILGDWLSAESLSFEDQGIDCFASWYWTLCKRACRDALKQCGPMPELWLLGPDRLASVAVEPERQDPYDRLSQAIDAMPRGRMKAAVLDWRAGLRERQSAKRLGISVRTVRRLRKRGLLFLRRKLSREADDER